MLYSATASFGDVGKDEVVDVMNTAYLPPSEYKAGHSKVFLRRFALESLHRFLVRGCVVVTFAAVSVRLFTCEVYWPSACLFFRKTASNRQRRPSKAEFVASSLPKPTMALVQRW
jgi:hypothetical protein